MSREANLDYYSIFCGVFLYREKAAGWDKRWQPWTHRLDNADGFKSHVRKTYYETFLHSIVPELAEDSADRVLVNHYTHTDTVNKTNIVEATAENTAFRVSYIDVILFPGNIGIYLFKVQTATTQTVTPQQVSAVLNFFRGQGNQITVNGAPMAIEVYLEAMLRSAVQLAPDWNKFSPQLKSYTIINDTQSDRFTEAHDILLFELSNAMPVGTYQSSAFAPSKSFFDSIFENNCTSVFSNWKALSLFDSFTRLSVQSPDPFKSWEFDYLNIYVLCLYTKYQLYYFNSQLKNVVKVSHETYLLKNQFIEFVNDHNHAYISYKFLPNLLYEKIHSSLVIQKEIDQIELKSMRLSEAYSDQKSKQLNLLVIMLSMLSVISALNDVSDWLSKMGVASEFIYSPIFPTSFFAIPVLFYFLWQFRKTR